MPETKLSRRLRAAFLLVRGGGTVADIGTDHALLPIALVKSGKAPFAIASDINRGPLEKADENIRREGLEEKISVHLANGAEGLSGRADEFVIAGMGGELIAKIIENAPFFKDLNLHFVLQPMTKTSHLRAFLWDNGFDIFKEIHIEDGEHLYTVMSVVYTSDKYYRARVEELVGKLFFLETYSTDSLSALLKMCEREISERKRKIEGKSIAGHDTSLEKGEMEDLLRICEIIRSKL